MSNALKQSERKFSSAVLIDERAGLGIARFTVAFTIVVVAAFITWADLTHLDEVANAPGTTMTVATILPVQHAEGGRIASVLVKEGDKVRVGQRILTFDAKAVLAEISLKKIQLHNIRARLEVILEELDAKTKLADEGLFPRMQLYDLIGSGKDAAGRIDELKKGIENLEAKLNDFVLYAPASGTVFKMRPLAENAYVRAAETILEIVPDGATLVAELQISPTDIGHVRVGQGVLIKFSAYDYTRYGGYSGTLGEISPTTLLDPNGQPYYRGKVAVTKAYLGSDQTHTLKAGMTVTADIKTGAKSIIQYLLKPIFGSAQQAFHER